MPRHFVPVFFTLLLSIASAASAAEPEPVSYYRQVRPILQAHCQGCHQPAKRSGDYLMTSFDTLLRGGESELAAVVPGKPEESYLLEVITPDAGEAYMPQDAAPLEPAEVELIARWVAQGAKNDTPQGVAVTYDADNPPVYTRPPVITSLDFSPDGDRLAVAGFHEALLVDAATGSPAGRLVGLSERVESVRFSPDGSRLAVTGGLPCRLGEVQVWDVTDRKLLLSAPITHDTVYGGCWSSDGKRIAVGCADNTVRAIDAATGDEVVKMAAHQDWVRGVVFSGDGKSLVSVSRDQTVKMTDVATERFVGNLTTHTPGVLRGGMIAIDRHPTRNEVLVGGADGAPKLFKMAVKAAPKSGGNPNQIREYPGMAGRVFDVRLSPDGARAFAASSLDGAGEIAAYETDSGKRLWQIETPETGIYALACSPDGKTLAASGADGRIRLIAADDGQITRTFLPLQLHESDDGASRPLAGAAVETTAEGAPTRVETLRIASLEAEPTSIRISRPIDYIQLLVTAALPDGSRRDATELAGWRVEGEVGRVSADGLFQPLADGAGRIVAELGGQQVAVPVEVTGLSRPYTPDFIRDVNPVLSRVGCNAGTCHGAAKGKNGFKLSLRGYDAVLDVRALTDDLAARRVNVASPEDSLMLLKATAAAPHEGGRLIDPDDSYYAIIHRWIDGGAKLNRDTPRVASIAISPSAPVLTDAGHTQRMRVVAMYADGSTRDVTHEASITSSNTEVATAGPGARMTAVGRGEAPVLARYEGAYAAATLTVMGDRSGFVWQQPGTWGSIDELVAAKWKRMKIRPSPLAGDAEFLRRVTLDLTGLPPTPDEVRAFLADERETRVKRDEVIDRLIGGEAYVEHWTNKWADLLQVNRKFLGTEGAAAFRKWIRAAVAENRPYDELADELLTATGSNRENPAASYYKILREPAETMENTTHLFLGVRFNCNKCHDHPFERWTQDQYYQTAAYFARFELEPDPASGKKKIGGTAVEGAKPLYEIVADKKQGEIQHDRTKAVTPPQFPFDCEYDAPKDATRRQEFAAWLTSPDNPYFARSYVNRLWGYLLGVGIIEPLDDIRAGNPPSNPKLLDHLTREFVDSGFDTRHVIRQICRSRTYQLSIATNRFNEDDNINYSHATARRLPAEVLYDAAYHVTGTTRRIPGVPAGTRAAALPDAGVELPDGFLGNLGRPARESACECERTDNLQLGSVMALISGPTIDTAISDPNNAVAELVAREKENARLIDELFLRILARPATPEEIEIGLAELKTMPAEHEELVARLSEYEKQLAPEIAEQEKERAEAIAAAEAALKDYEKKIAPRETKLEKQRRDKIAAAEAALKQYEKRLPELLAAWEKQAGQPVAWTSLEAVELKASNGAKFEKQDDRSLFVTGPGGKGTYTVVARSDLAGVTGIKLEAIPDDRLSSKGPGRSQNGNFVLTEFRVAWASQNEPKKTMPVALQNARADFSQNNYGVKTAIDGKKAATNNGWATHPRTGEHRTAVFETRDDVGPGRFTFHLDQEYQDGKHSLGRFRLSATDAARPLSLEGLPEPITTILAVAPGKRTEQQKASLRKFYRGTDAKLKKLEAALAEAKKPRPVDPKFKQLRGALAAAEEPLPVDPKLARLRRAAQLSATQLEDARLTFAQDLAWALINSPAFLFNR